MEDVVGASSKPHTAVVAVSGGIGSGKSAVCAILRDFGARLFNADAEARRLMEHDNDLRAAIAAHFGEESFLADGSLDRAYLAERVFSNERDRRLVNSLVHPAVAQAFEQERKRAEEDGVPMLVHESALITEVAHRDRFDAIIIVESPLADRIERVTTRDRTTREAVAARIRAQPTETEFREVADYIVVNDGTFVHLRKIVERVYRDVLRGSTVDETARDADG